MKKPILYVFAISHFCEKARWAMDRSGIEYKLKFMAPGVHAQKATKLGLDKTSVPFLQTEDGILQGSPQIIDWIDANLEDTTLNLTPNEECRSLEQRLDDKIGIHIRRYYYSEAMLDCPETVKPIFKIGIPFHHKLLVDSIWSKVPAMMAKSMDLGPEQHLQSRAIVDSEMDWLDNILKDGRRYLSGDVFTRADLAAASLLAPLVSPANHPTYSEFVLPPRVSADTKIWENRPILKWVDNMYQTHR